MGFILNTIGLYRLYKRIGAFVYFLMVSIMMFRFLVYCSSCCAVRGVSGVDAITLAISPLARFSSRFGTKGCSSAKRLATPVSCMKSLLPILIVMASAFLRAFLNSFGSELMAAKNSDDVAPLLPNFTTLFAPEIKSGKAVVDGGGYPKVMESPSAT